MEDMRNLSEIYVKCDCSSALFVSELANGEQEKYAPLHCVSDR
jgi:hypothetical protein